jgi:TolA-binding protein
MASKSKEISENEEIVKTLIKSYENLEEKLNKNNETIKELEKELNGGSHQGEKREKVKNFLPGQVKNSILSNE